MSTSPEVVDVAVIGGGPGGSMLATLLAQSGYRVLLLEKEQFPRYQIGESLLPPTIGLCHHVGLGAALDAAGFTPKNGGAWYWGTSEKPGWGFDFDELPKAPKYGRAWAYQVERSKFDELLLRHAQSCGVVVRERHRVTEVLEEPKRVVGLRYADESGGKRDVLARFVVDAGGHKSPFHRMVGERKFSHDFRNVALHCYFKGGKRLPQPQSGSILNVSFSKGWFWYIPLASELTSVGAVVTADNTEVLRQDPEAAMNGLIASCPLIQHFLSGVERVSSGQYGRHRVRSDWSYENTRFWKPGMVLVGDAACFVDPLFSSGVHLATYSAFLAARAITSAFDNPSLERVALDKFEDSYRREYRYFFDYLMFFYDTNRTKEEYFRHARRVLGRSETAKRAFVRLVGGFGSIDEFRSTERKPGGGGSRTASAARAIDHSPGNIDVCNAIEVSRLWPGKRG